MEVFVHVGVLSASHHDLVFHTRDDIVMVHSNQFTS